jgi:dienelactone hydrolase
MKLKTFIKYFILTVLSGGLHLFLIVYQEFSVADESKFETRKIRDKDMVADFIYPKGASRLPVVIFLTGSGGGLGNVDQMEYLALQGYAVLCLAYFNMEGLPAKLEEIPLEYFEHAMKWVARQPEADSTKLFVLGVSRGAELAMLLASTYPQIKGVIAYAPGSFILPNATEISKGTPSKSSWTYKNEPFSFAPLKVLQEDNTKEIRYREYIEPLFQEKEQMENWMIKVENIKAPILLLSGTDDQQWPAAEMATLIEKRLKEKNFLYPVYNKIYPNAGHILLQLDQSIPIISTIFFQSGGLTINGKPYRFTNGGTVLGNILAKRKAREETLAFLQKFTQENSN